MAGQKSFTATRGGALSALSLVGALIGGCGHRETEVASQVPMRDRMAIAGPTHYFAANYSRSSSAGAEMRPIPMPRHRLSYFVPPSEAPRAAAATPPNPKRVSVAGSQSPSGPLPTAERSETLPPAVEQAPTANTRTAAVPPLAHPSQAAAQPSTAQPVIPKVELIPAPVTDLTPRAAAPTIPAAPQASALPATPMGRAEIIPPRVVAKADAKINGTKVTSLTEQTRVKDALDRADKFLLAGQPVAARALLQEAARGENADLLTALAASYDPLVLKDYPKSASAADPARATELYAAAIAKGSKAAEDRRTKLTSELAKPKN